ncbi:MAG: hypothetical protein ACI9XO_000926 [Paraglaciecola sp.]|jgi:hypothetical protein
MIQLKELIIKPFAWILVGMTIAWNPALGATSEHSIFDLMNHTEVLELTLEADISDLSTNRNTEEYQAGFVRFADDTKMEQAWNVKIRPRGKYRRRICEMPPLKLKFKKAELETAGLSKFNDLKLVTHCSKNKLEAKEWLMKEYLTYKLYNELTPNSFRVQLVRINYIDVPTGKKTKNWGFLIEDKDQVADRIDAETCDCNGMDMADLNQNSEKLMTVFQYMIGNEDWDLMMVRNLKMFKKADGQIIPVPYDFDFAGIVNAGYAIPNATYNMTSIVDRAYFGTAQKEENLTSTMRYLKLKKKDLISIVKNFKSLSFENRATIVHYLQSFYNGNENFVKVEKHYKQGVNTAKSTGIAK